MVAHSADIIQPIQYNPAENLGNEKPVPISKYKCIFGEFETQLYWGNIIAIFTLHMLTLYGIIIHFQFRISLNLMVFCLVVGQFGGFGITAGIHRYWTHRCFKAKLPLKIILLICYSIAGQNTIYEWVRDHRVHHKFSETVADPHDANRGFWFAHVGWLCMRKHPEVIRKGKLVNLSDITSDPLLRFHIKYWIFFKILFCFLLPISIPPLCWGESWIDSFWANLFRYCLLLNFTWCVNSVAHMWGQKPYDKNIQPVENLFVSVVTFGEGWHNYHHSFPWDYRAAELGTGVNLTTFLLNCFAKIGWAYDFKEASPELVQCMKKSKGDGSR